MIELAPPPEWHDRAACAGSSVDFFPEHGGAYTEAAKLCDACPVSAECLTAAFEEEDAAARHGMRGGKTPTERHIIAGTGRTANHLDGPA